MKKYILGLFVLASLVVLPSISQATTVAGWQTYTNTQYEFSIQYPSNYKPADTTYGWPHAIVLFGGPSGQSYYLPIEIWSSQNELNQDNAHKYYLNNITVKQIGNKYISLWNVNHDAVVDQMISTFALATLPPQPAQPYVQSFTVTPSITYPNAYTVSWTLSGVNQADLTIDCRQGLSIINPESGKVFQCGDVANPIYGYTVSQDLQFTNNKNQSMAVNVLLSPVGVNAVSKTITIPPTQSTNPTLVNFTVLPATFNPRSYQNAYEVSYSFSNTLIKGVTVGVDCYKGLTVKKMDDGGNLSAFSCGDIGIGGVNGYFPSGGYDFNLVFTNTSNQPITTQVVLSANGFNTVTRSVTIPPKTISSTPPTSAQHQLNDVSNRKLIQTLMYQVQQLIKQLQQLLAQQQAGT